MCKRCNHQQSIAKKTQTGTIPSQSLNPCMQICELTPLLM